ncbi:MAG: hypothetical protein QOK47_1281 [Actinomycetota bacterium]|jgi:predicted short-subunit dehydrogenase-like oxidoreductase (DUF2520 family)|nr:hypothetical protein [Actinomycetota bacterium]
MSTLPPARFRFALIGAGRVGTAVSVLLQQAGHEPIGVVSRSNASASAAAERLNSRVSSMDDLASADVYLIGTGLDALSEVAGSIPEVDGKTVIHFAGAAGVEPLSGVVDRGGLACALHPVQACPTVDIAIARLPGSAWGVTCTPEAVEWADQLIADEFRGFPVAVAESDRSLWHVAAVVTSNGIAALVAAGELMLEEIGIAEPERVLGPIAVGTAENVRDGGGGARMLTGPIVRGEVATIERHIESLQDRPHDLADLYRLISALVLLIARRTGRIEATDAERITEALR